MTKGAKIVSIYVLISAMAGLGVFSFVFYQSAQEASFDILSLVLLLALPIAGLVAGIFMLKKAQWAYFLAAAYFAVQIPRFQSESFFYLMHSGFELHFDYRIGPYIIGINFLALAWLLYTSRYLKAAKAA